MATITAKLPTDWVAPIRGVDSQEQFSLKANDAWVKLRSEITPQTNLFGEQANSLRNEVNGFRAEALANKNSATASATTATTKASEASTSASNALASQNKAKTSETNSKTSETNAGLSAASALSNKNATDLNKSASATSEANALTYRNTASTHATTATTKASEALTSATSATISATTATTQAGIATSRANEALASKNSAEASATTATTQANISKGYADSINPSTLVKLTGNQTVAGIKTFSSTISGSITGNSATATTLATARTINGVAFNGSANITVSDSTAVKLTGNQTVAGVKTFTSSPIVPTPTIDFQSVPLRSTSITVNVGAGQTYTTINQALEYLSGFYPMYKKSGVIATINLKAGFVMAEQVLVSGIDLGWITIVGEDAETIITHTALTTSFNGTNYPAFGVDKGGTSPVIGQLFRFNVEKVGGNKHGLMAFGAGSSADVLSGKGFIGAGTYGIYAYSSTINAYTADCSNAGIYGIYASASSIINANGAIIQNQTTGTARVRVLAGSTIAALGIITTGGTVAVFSQSINTLTANGIIYQ